MSATRHNPSRPRRGVRAPREADDCRAELRVIVVGRTGVDAVLRRDRRVELVRARTALDAIGELADPIDEQTPLATAVLVGSPIGDDGHDDAEFVAALRRLDPSVRVVRVGRTPGPYDAAIEPEADPARLHDVLVGVTPETRDDSQIDALLRDATTRVSAAGESDLVRLVLAGRDVIGPAMGLIREKLGNKDVSYVDGPDQPGEGAVAARWNGRTVGWLVGADPAELAGQADWLAAWVTLSRQQAQLRRAAFTDPLTGAWNRRYFERFLASAIDLARQDRVPLTILMFDIDDFKRYNDRYGHAAGDEILTETVRLLRSVIRPTDKVCRFGGDEFVVIFHEPDGPRDPGSTPPQSIFQIARRFQQQVSEHRFPKLGQEAPGTLTISGGLATFPWDGRSADELLARADELLLQSKAQGKNAITFGPGGVEGNL